jgi:hypothetical protein
MWHIHNRTPYAAARTWVQDPDGTKRWVVVVKATFDIQEDGRLTLAVQQLPPLLTPEYHGVDGASSLRYEADLVSPKPGTDVVLNGHAYPPRGRAATGLAIALGVGAHRKVLQVTGDRVYRRTLVGTIAPSAPEPFVRMPIMYERAFGGHDTSSPNLTEHRLFTPNPIGTGYVGRRASLVGRPVANVEHPGASLGHHGAAGFGAICSHWSPRRELAGTYDAGWVAARKPLLPEDFDPRFHMYAPLDQQHIPHLRGGMPIELVNLMPGGVLRFALPKVWLAFRTRIVMRRVEHRREHRAKLHTVVLEPDHPRVVLVWHTSLPCTHDAEYLEDTTISEKPYL